MSSNPSMLAALRDELRALPPPIVVFNKSHSGSRLLARVLAAGGVFMGAHLNESQDSVDLLPLVEYLVCRYYPDYGPLWRDDTPPDRHLPVLIREVVAGHLNGVTVGGDRRWGWKLCETGYILPVLDYLFPAARVVHLIRDGRDVAFCDHVPPIKPFWKKVYFDTDAIRTWSGRRLTRFAYERRSYVFNAQHWLNSVRVGRAYGAPLRERYREVRYEDLCTDFAATVRELFTFVGLAGAERVIAELAPTVGQSSVGKYREQPRRKVRRVVDLAKPMLLALGYLPPETPAPRD